MSWATLTLQSPICLRVNELICFSTVKHGFKVKEFYTLQWVGLMCNLR